jgi:hypothetical protein
MQRVMQGVFEQTPHVASVCSDSQTTRPAIRSGIVGEFGETRRLFLQRVDDGVGIGAAVARSRGIDQIIIDSRERRLVERQGLFDPEHMQRRDVSAVRRIFERRPDLRLGTLTKFGTGVGQQESPPRPEDPQSVQQRGIVVAGTVEAAGIAVLMLHHQRRYDTDRSYALGRSSARMLRFRVAETPRAHDQPPHSERSEYASEPVQCSE